MLIILAYFYLPISCLPSRKWLKISGFQHDVHGSFEIHELTVKAPAKETETPPCGISCSNCRFDLLKEIFTFTDFFLVWWLPSPQNHASKIFFGMVFIIRLILVSISRSVLSFKKRICFSSLNDIRMQENKLKCHKGLSVYSRKPTELS